MAKRMIDTDLELLLDCEGKDDEIVNEGPGRMPAA